MSGTPGMYHSFIRHCCPTCTRDTGGPQVLKQTEVSKALKSLQSVTARAARPGEVYGSLPIHSGWDRGNSMNDRVSFLLSRAANRQDYWLHPVTRSTFCIKVLQFHGHAYFSKCKKLSWTLWKRDGSSKKLQHNSISPSKKGVEGEKCLFLYTSFHVQAY